MSELQYMQTVALQEEYEQEVCTYCGKDKPNEAYKGCCGEMHWTTVKEQEDDERQQGILGQGEENRSKARKGNHRKAI